jgi:rhomboid family GlyGly-CTERM serine protease
MPPAGTRFWTSGTSSLADRRPDLAWLLLGSALAAGSLLGWYGPQDTLAWHADRALSQPWQLLTAAWVHLSPAHLFINLAGTVVVLAFGLVAGCGRRDAAAWLLAWPLTHALLWLHTGMQVYAGLSGVLHAGVAVACMALVTRARGLARGVGVAVLLGLLAKLVLEDPLSAPVQHSPDWGFPVAVLAHSTGAAAGLVCALVAWVTSPRQAVTTMD